jgi:hypothetical protein
MPKLQSVNPEQTLDPLPDDGQPTSNELLRLGITRTMTERFTVGGYHYTSLDDAIAEAKRQAKARNDD